MSRRKSVRTSPVKDARPVGISALVDYLECRLFLSSVRQVLRPTVTPVKSPKASVGAIVLKRTPATRYASKHASPANTSGPTGLTPTQVRHAYGLDSVVSYNSDGSVSGAGAGQTIAVIDAYYSPTIVNDLQQFSTRFGLPTANISLYDETGNPITTSNHPTVDPATSGTTWELETALDVEWVHAMAPSANILLVECDTSDLTDLISYGAKWAAKQPGVSVVTMSFGAPEFSYENVYDGDMVTPSGHPGVTFVAATGDAGAPASYPAFSPNVVAVGGTNLKLNSTTGNYLSETGWSGSGGGISQYETQPTFQNGVVTQSTTMRTAPDISMDADPNSGVPIYDSYDNASLPWAQIGGTSLAAPLFASVLAIGNQGRVLQGLTNLDGPSQTLPLIYGAPAAALHDVTSGHNGASGFDAGVGYDLVTGRGTPNGSAFINVLSPPATAGTATLPAGVNSVLVKRDPDNLHADITVTNSSGTTTIMPLLSQTTPFVITGGSGDDTVTFDFSAGMPLPVSGASFSGGTGANVVTVVGTTGNDAVNVGIANVTVTGGVAALPGGTFSNVPITTSSVQAVNLPGGSGGSDSITFTSAVRQTNADTATGTPNVSVTALAGAIVTFITPQHLAALSVDNAAAVLSAAAAQLTVAGALSLSNGGTLDLIQGQLLLNTAVTSAAAVRTYLSNGYHGGAWNGTGGILSSAAAASPSTGTLGYAVAGDSTTATVAAGTLLIKYTTPADANLSGVTDSTDFTALQSSFGVAGDWSQGDFDYNGVVNFSDFLILQNAMNH